uniref:Allene oxide synthase, chloroplastic n=1 Tax=Aegilops tauschii TaxID=37682 RepID=M8C663_AEGTA
MAAGYCFRDHFIGFMGTEATREAPAANAASRPPVPADPSTRRVGGRFWVLAASDDEEDDDGDPAGRSPADYSPTPSDVICEAFNPRYSEEEMATLVDDIVPGDDLARIGLRTEDRVEVVRRIIHRRTAATAIRPWKGPLPKVATLVNDIVPGDDPARIGLRTEDRVEVVRRIIHRRTAATAIQPWKGPLPKAPGSYGLPFVSAIRDRLDFYYFQGEAKYFESRVEKHGSTVLRINVPPGPFMARDPRVVAVLDAKSFPVLFDVDKVEKKNLFTGTYMPSTSLTGGFRVCSYLDPSEPTHTKVKQLLFSLLASRKDAVIPAFRSHFSSLLATVESQLVLGGKSNFNMLNDFTSFEFIADAYFGVLPSASDLGTTGPTKAAKWLIFQLHPLVTFGLPLILEEPLLHTVLLPPIFVSGDYKALYKYFYAAATKALDMAESLGLNRDEACHNLLFATVFNSYGGLKVMLPGILGRIAEAGEKFHQRLAAEALEKMELTKSAVWEALRLDPPGKGSKLLQYVYWSNGRETESPSVDNKQCPGKNLVVLVGRLLVVEMFLRYDTFAADVGVDLLGPKVEFTGVTKATSGPGAV